MKSNLYGRLLTNSELHRLADEAKAAGATLDHDTEAGTMLATLDGKQLFRAIQKGEDSEPWIVAFNPDAYPRDEDEQRAAYQRMIEAQAAADELCGFYLLNAAGDVIGANGQRHQGAGKFLVLTLPKFKTMRAARIFVRWAGLRGFGLSAVTK